MRSLVRSTAIMSIGTVLSRATGVLRLAAIAAAIGVTETRLTDAYNYANTAPNIIYELILGGILTSVFVPVFVELLEKEGREKAWVVGSAILNLSMVVLSAVTVLGIAAAPWIARFYSVEGAGQERVIAFLLRLFIPQMIFYALTAITAGMLNAHKRFGPPMFTPVLNNLAVIAVFVAFHAAYPDGADLETVTNEQMLVIGLGTTAGVALMAVAQLPFLRGLGRYKLTFSIAHPSVRKLAKLSVFVIGYVVANQIGYLIVQYLARTDEGGYSSYIAAYTFFLLPHGLFAVSINTALIPGMSGHATNERWNEFRERLSVGVRTTSLLILPAAVGYLALGEPIIRILLERGVMTGQSTAEIAGVLQFFTLGLLPFSLFQLFLRSFYAMQDTKTPFLINCGAVALHTAVNVPMFAWLGVRGLAAGHALAYLVGATMQGRSLAKRIGGLDGRRIVRSVARMALAAGLMGAVVWVTAAGLERALGIATTTAQLVTLGVPIALGVGLYLGLAHLLRIEELDYARSLLGGRFSRREGGR